MSRQRNQLHRRTIPGTARFLTFGTYGRLRLFDNDRIKDRFVVELGAAVAAHKTQLIAWVVMPEHVHLIVHFEGEDRVTAFLRTLKRPFARTVLDRWRSLNAPILSRLSDASGQMHFWQSGGGYDRNVVDREVIEKIRYIHGNPFTRGLSPDSVGWKWSSARSYRGLDDALGPPIAFQLIPEHQGELT